MTNEIDISKVLIEGDTATIMGVKYKRIEEPKSPAEEAYKEVYGWYPPTTSSVSNYEDNRWSAFQNGYNASKVSETPQEPDDKNLKNSLDLIKEWGEKNKPPTLYEILMEWWINHLDMEQSDEEIVNGLVDMIDRKFIPPSSDRNGYEWEKCLKMMREKLR